MKTNKSILCAFVMMTSVQMFAQTQYDAERLIGTELNGTARFVGMGGAMGSLGGDLSVMATNPAGIGIYRSNDIALTFGFNNTSAEATFGGTKLKDNRTRWSFDQIGFVYSNKVGNDTSLRYMNFGFNFRKNKNFNKLFAAGGELGGLSQTFQMSSMMGDALNINNVPEADTGAELDAIYDAKNPYMWNDTQYPYLGIMGVRTELVGVNSNNKLTYWDGDMNKYTSREEGGINEYDFNVAFNLEDRIYLGATLGAYDVNYKRFSYYTEDISYYNETGTDVHDDYGMYELSNWFETKGTGVDLKLGFIARPFEESPFRIGLAVHTPTWYELTDYHSAILHPELTYVTNGVKEDINIPDEDTFDYNNDGDIQRDYKLVTPWKFNVSAGTTISNLLALGAEYEYSDYSTAKLKYDDNENMEFQNSTIKEDLKGVHTLRLGMEAKLAPEFSIRAGYNYSTAAFKNSAYKMLDWNSTRTDTEYNNSKEKNTFTFGVGYRGSVIYADLAYKYDNYKSDFYAFDDTDLKAVKVDNSRNQLLFTIGARF